VLLNKNEHFNEKALCKIGAMVVAGKSAMVLTYGRACIK
jgi:hypothetical protein